MPERQQSPTAAEAEAALHKQYKRLYAQLSMQAQHKLFSGKTLSGREPLYEQSVSVNGASITATAENPFLRFVRTQRLPANLAPTMASFNAMRVAAEDRAHRSRLMGMTAWQRHVHFINTSRQFYGGGDDGSGSGPPPNPTVRTDHDILRENYRFIREEDDNAPGGWEVNLARKYYAKLFREYCIADLSRYKEGKVGLRWRVQKEVIAGKGQFVCGARGCDMREGLASFEVQFAYAEAGAQKAALVKVRLCPKHALQLNYQKNQQALQEERRRKEEKRAAKKRKSAKNGSPKKAKRSRRSSSGSPHGPGGVSPQAGAADAVTNSGEAGGGHPQAGAPAKEAAAASAPGHGGVDTDVDAFFQGLFD